MHPADPDTKHTAINGTIAIVDDDPDISRALGMWLEMFGLRAAQHGSGESLLHDLSQQDGRLTVHFSPRQAAPVLLLGAVIDLNLPGISGIELAQTLRRLMPDLPMVIITALHEGERQRFGPAPPGVQCLKKPFDLGVLEDALFPMLH